MDLDFHRDCLMEMVRVCSGEIRIYPLTGLDAEPYPFLNDILRSLDKCNLHAELIQVPFEFQKGSHTMMRIQCSENIIMSKGGKPE